MPDIALNHKVASLLREIAELLEQQGANPFRVNAYRHAADTVDRLDISVKAIVERKGIEGLVALPNIGVGIGRSIFEYVMTERMSRLEGLSGGIDSEALFQTVPGIGPRLAQRIHLELHIETLEALELAASSGRLARLSGVGVRRAQAIEASLAEMLGRQRFRRQAREPDYEPMVSLLLKIDEQYRNKASAGELPLIAPKRFNPEGKAWLPIMHTTSKGWHFTALYSNTERAHKLHKTDDWVVLYFYDDHHQEGQHTVVTETHGPLINRRVVRGREMECRQYYDDQD